MAAYYAMPGVPGPLIVLLVVLLLAAGAALVGAGLYALRHPRPRRPAQARPGSKTAVPPVARSALSAAIHGYLEQRRVPVQVDAIMTDVDLACSEPVGLVLDAIQQLGAAVTVLEIRGVLLYGLRSARGSTRWNDTMLMYRRIPEAPAVDLKYMRAGAPPSWEAQKPSSDPETPVLSPAPAVLAPAPVPPFVDLRPAPAALRPTTYLPPPDPFTDKTSSTTAADLEDTEP